MKEIMSEKQEREQSLQPLHDLALELSGEMGVAPEERLDWLLRQDGESFGGLLIKINASARSLPEEGHGFDGENVRVGTSIPPDQEDKMALLGELLKDSQQHAREQTAKGENSQAILYELAMFMPVVINKLHLFGNGNGRTSRFMRMMVRDGDQLSPGMIDLLVNKDRTERYDTTPAGPVERALRQAIEETNGTGSLSVIDDLDESDGPRLLEQEVVKRKYPTLDPGITLAYIDPLNFNEAIRLLAKAKDLEGGISLKQMLDDIAQSPEAQQDFIKTYRNVRKQRVELLMQGLLGKKDVPVLDTDKDKDVNRWINYARQRKGLPSIDPTSIRTIQEFQMAYMEAFSPEREQQEPPELFIKHKVLYHGSATNGIQGFNHAEESTVGRGIYFVDNPNDAAGYAKRSADRDKKPPVVYEAEIEEAKLVNLDNAAKLAEIMSGYAKRLLQLRQNPNLSWIQQGVIDRGLSRIDKVKPGYVKWVTQTNGHLFADYLKELGYDGLKASEGGEPPFVGPHASYVVFDSDKVKIKSEEPVE